MQGPAFLLFAVARGLPRLLPVLLTLIVALPASSTLAEPRPAPGRELPNRTQDEIDEIASACMECHADADLTMEFGDGTTKSLVVHPEALGGSVHAGQVACSDCHTGYDEDHPMGKEFANPRQYRLASYELCRNCHFDTYTRTLESVHYELVKAGREDAPVCADCHGGHAILDPRQRHTMVSRSCATCHADIHATYAKSVHGRALVEDENEDVPACADCHTSHQMKETSTARFRLGAPATCIGCHGDTTRMGKYGIPTYAAETYLADFHGATASLSRNLREEDARIVVTCNDCHGIHDIGSPKEIGAEAMKARVEAACISCHEDATPDFPAAWLSHYPPSPRHAPLVWAVGVFYRLFIPFVVGGLLLHLGFHFRRLRASAR